jgi:hypothetical protein
MNKKFKHLLIAIGLLSSMSNANAAIVTWTFDNIYFDRFGFTSQILTGTLSYDADNNVFTNSTLVRRLSNTDPILFPGAAISLNNTSNANGLSFIDGQFSDLSGSITFSTPLTNAGGTVFLSSGNLITSAGSIWSLRGEQSISAPLTSAVPEPEAYALMLAGLGLAGFAARRKSA